ncbi:class I SAM-dependent DNA methyltransferase [Mycolicibacterium tusciae]|nr:class I SAM-dependent methyltransferase [Mycolicibacterium tusciae]
MKLKAVQEIYLRYAKVYDRELRDDMKYTAYLEVPQMVIDAVGPRQGNVLDLGCGTGLSSRLFLDKGWRVTGIEGTGEMARKARRLPFTTIIQQDLESSWRVADNSFDAIVMIGVMEYLTRPDRVFRQAHRKLVQGGLMGVTVPNKNKACTAAGLKSYFKREIAPVLLKSGFKIERCRKTLGFEDAGEKVLYWNFLLRKR